jgi:ureidoglycolate lyase
MRTIRVRKLTHEAFAPYGHYAEMVNPIEPLTGKDMWFFPDMATLDMGIPSSTVSFSTCKTPRIEYVIKEMESHSHTGEGILPLDGDCILYMAMPQFDLDKALEFMECFLIPKGTMVILKPAVWHYAPYPVTGDSVSAMIVLPTRTYANDCVITRIPEDKWIRFELA